MKMGELKVGEKYLSIKIVGHDFIKAFPNKDREDNKKQPHFKGDGVAVWVQEKQSKDKIETDYL